MKTIAQLLQLSKNPYYTFTDEEKEVLDAFLLTQREQLDRQGKHSSDSSKNTPAIVISRNIVPKETGEIPEE